MPVTTPTNLDQSGRRRSTLRPADPLLDQLLGREAILAGLAHDLKNPLTRIKTGAQLLRRRLQRPEELDVDRLSQGLEQIEAAANRLARLIDDLVDLGYQGEAATPDARPTDLVRLARYLVEAYQQTSERHRIVLRADLPSLVGTWAPSQLERALSNLLSNAVKYSPAGGDVVVTLGREAAADRDWAVIAVRDHGLGIPAGDLDRVFDRFQRASNAVGHVAGTGMGLATVHQIAEQHGGTITVASEEGRGSVFTIRLPLDGDSQA